MKKTYGHACLVAAFALFSNAALMAQPTVEQMVANALELEASIQDLARANEWVKINLRVLSLRYRAEDQQEFDRELLGLEEALVEVGLSQEVPVGFGGSVEQWHRRRFAFVAGYARSEERQFRTLEIRPVPEVFEVLVRVSDRLLEAGAVKASIQALEPLVPVAAGDPRRAASLESRARESNERATGLLRLMARPLVRTQYESFLRGLWGERERLPPDLVRTLRALPVDWVV